MPVNNFNSAFDVVKQDGENALVVKIHEGYSPNDVLRFYLQQDVAIKSFHEILPSLNEIFIQLVEGTPSARQFQTITA